MKLSRLGYLATLAIMVALVRPALADDDEMGGMDDGGGGWGEMGGMEDGGDWGLGGLIDEGIESFGHDDGGYSDPGYEGEPYPSDPEPYPSYPEPYPSDPEPYPNGPFYPSDNGGYTLANNGSGYAPQHAPLPANRLPPQHSGGTSSSTACPPANSLPRQHASNKPTPTDVVDVETCTPPANSLPQLTNSTPRVFQLGPPCSLPEAQLDDPPSEPNPRVAEDGPDETDDAPGSGAIMTQDSIDSDIVDEQRRQDPLVRRLLDAIPNQQAVDVLVAQLPNPPYNERMKSDIRRAVNEGNLTELRRLDRGVNSPAFTRLVQITTAIQAVNRIRDKAQRGTLTQTDIRNAATALQPFTSANPQVNNAVQQILRSLLSSSNTIARLRNNLRRVRPVVSPPSITQRRRPISSSARPVVVARQPAVAPTPAVVPSRMSARVPTGGPVAVPARAAAPALAASQTPARRTSERTASIVLVNADEQSLIRYIANGEQHAMKPGFEHSLSGGSQWLVEFDRGDDFGIARYGLVSGRYEFVVTERGWELVQAASPAGDVSAKQTAIDDEVNLQDK
jgi:hypothetical protein